MNKPNSPNQFPREYQRIAKEKWIENNFIGLFEMATGTGKTVTALSCAEYLMVTEEYLQLFILVPSIDLAFQWLKEIRSRLTRNVILANSKNLNWYRECSDEVKHNQKGTYCIIVTYATFLTSKFQSLIRNVSEKALLIADEVHNFGTSKHIADYPFNIKRRLGLSATPIRYYDDIGSDAILTYFGSRNGITFKYDLEDAIRNGYLCEYYYYPTLVELQHDELEAYEIISKKLAKYFKGEKSEFLSNPAVVALLLKRRRIIHKAKEKFQAFKDILSNLVHVQHNLKFLLVYVPEGSDQHIDNDDHRLIDEYSKIIYKDFGLSQHQFIGLTKNREKILEEFSKGKIAVLTAMKCLDEGVDIKRAEFAIFCSSTGNPKQFIQRRGRILRIHPDKKNATIYDLIVIPPVDSQSSNIQMERAILQSELKRVYEFAKLALNHYQALALLEATALKFDIDIYSSEIG